MSFNRLNYDTCAYKQNLYQSVGPGEYRLTEPPNTEEICFANSPQIRMQYQGVSVPQDKPLIDVDSELLNLTRPATNCPSRKYIPDGSQCGLVDPRDEEKNKVHGKDCFFTVEDTRLSNPPCTLRGTGWNRWEWLCLDPQERVLMPFDHNISNRLVVKDNHRPCIPEPIDVNLSLPPQTGEIVASATRPSASVPTGPPSIQWVDATTMKKL